MFDENNNGTTCSTSLSFSTNFMFDEIENGKTCSIHLPCPSSFMFDENKTGETCAIHVSCPTTYMFDEHENEETWSIHVPCNCPNWSRWTIAKKLHVDLNQGQGHAVWFAWQRERKKLDMYHARQILCWLLWYSRCSKSIRRHYGRGGKEVALADREWEWRRLPTSVTARAVATVSLLVSLRGQAERFQIHVNWAISCVKDSK